LAEEGADFLGYADAKMKSGWIKSKGEAYRPSSYCRQVQPRKDTAGILASGQTRANEMFGGRAEVRAAEA
jgi:hypothetical protein